MMSMLWKEKINMHKEIVEILMNRDEISKEEAIERINTCKSRLNNEAVAAGDYFLAEDIIAEELGLEPDYMIELLL